MFTLSSLIFIIILSVKVLRYTYRKINNLKDILYFMLKLMKTK